MAFSPLVTKIILSPNCSSPRSHAIDTITIHHMAAKWTADKCGKSFQSASRQASSNYGIGYDGIIDGYVDELNRAWTSGNRTNDHRAVTIEVSNDMTGGNWHVSDVAMDSLIKLCADICKRNGIKKLVWSDNKDDRINHKNGCNMTIHRDFQATSCPGEYLLSKMSYIADSVNEILNPQTKVEYQTEVFYTVVKGDTLSSIGRKFGVTYKYLANLNGISFPYIIKVGQKLKIK